MRSIDLFRSEAEKLVILIDCHADPQDSELRRLAADLREKFGMATKEAEEAYRDGLTAIDPGNAKC